MKEILTQVRIQATPQRLWQMLTDFESYPRWNPFIRSIDGVAVRGAQLAVELSVAPGKITRFTPTLVEASPNSELRWVGKAGAECLFRGEHYFRLSPASDGGVLLTHGERFTGLLVPFLWSWLEGPTRAGFEKMNAALKSALESQCSLAQGAT